MMNFKNHILIRVTVTLLLAIGITIMLHYLTSFNPFLLGGLVFLLFVLTLSVLLKKLITPLTETVQTLKKNNLNEDETEFKKSTIKEINTLNIELNEYASLTKEQYLYQRQYSENLSHELLTPLAVIRTKAELIFQNPNLRESDLLNLDRILQTVQRLSKVNQALILLSKINNNQFVDEEEIDLKELINDSLENFEDQIRKKQLTVRLDLSDGKKIISNRNLLHILIVNLVKNAVFHNVENGSIHVSLKKKVLTITNTGLESNINPEDYFQRFVSHKKNNDSIGLGLAIVKQICTFLGYDIVYNSVNAKHEVIVKF